MSYFIFNGLKALEKTYTYAVTKHAGSTLALSVQTFNNTFSHVSQKKVTQSESRECPRRVMSDWPLLTVPLGLSSSCPPLLSDIIPLTFLISLQTLIAHRPVRGLELGHNPWSPANQTLAVVFKKHKGLLCSCGRNARAKTEKISFTVPRSVKTLGGKKTNTPTCSVVLTREILVC